MLKMVEKYIVEISLLGFVLGFVAVTQSKHVIISFDFFLQHWLILSSIFGVVMGVVLLRHYEYESEQIVLEEEEIEAAKYRHRRVREDGKVWDGKIRVKREQQ